MDLLLNGASSLKQLLLPSALAAVLNVCQMVSEDRVGGGGLVVHQQLSIVHTDV